MLFWDHLAMFGAVGSSVLAIRLLIDVQDLRTHLNLVNNGMNLLRDEVSALEARVGIKPFEAPSASETPRPPMHEDIPLQTAPPQAPQILTDPWKKRATSSFPKPSNGPGWENVLAENWLVWLGGIALALGGAFMVKLSIDQGYLTPLVRVVLGTILGIAMSVGAEWISRDDRLAASRRIPFYIPSALASAGAVTTFASFYAAYQLYDLIPAPLAFVLLALSASMTVIMSLRHGVFVAGLGLIGAFIVPMLVRSDDPKPLILFVYLTLISSAALVLVRYKAWWWLAWGALVGSAGWALIWLAGPYGHRDVAIVGGFLLLELGLFASFRRGIRSVPFLAGVIVDPMVQWVVRAAFWTISTLFIALVYVDQFQLIGLIWAYLASVFLLWFALRDDPFDDLILIAAALPLCVLAIWNPDLPTTGGVEKTVTSNLSDVFVRYATMALISGLTLGLAGFLVLARVPRPGRWAALSAAAPLAIFVVSYWRLDSFNRYIPLTLIPLGLAGLSLIAADWVSKRRDGGAEIEKALAAYAVGVLGSTIFAATIAFENAWLSVALALHLPAIAWVEQRLAVPVLRRLALGIAGIVLARLMLNPEILVYPVSKTLGFNWLLYGYGIPAIAFFAAKRQFETTTGDLLVEVLEAGSVALGAALVTLELRHALNHGRLDLTLLHLGRDSVQTSVWLVMAAGLLHWRDHGNRRVLKWAGLALFALATSQAVIWQAILANPVLTGEPVGPWLFFDSLSIAYAMPALLYGGFAVLKLGPPILVPVSRLLALSFALLWVTLEVRHGFRGEILSGWHSNQPEWYAYSCVWLVFSGACLAIGLTSRSVWLRQVGLLGIGLVVIKVFGSDMANLAGAWRALSFLGLGAALIGTGYAYRQFLPASK